MRRVKVVVLLITGVAAAGIGGLTVYQRAKKQEVVVASAGSDVERAAIAKSRPPAAPAARRAPLPVRPNPPDEGIRIPADDEGELDRMTEAVSLSPVQRQRVKPLLKSFVRARALIEKYPEAARPAKQEALERQAYLAMLTAVNSEQWPLMDEYLAKRKAMP